MQASIVIPTLGRPASLERALRSAIGQTGAAEIVVVDNDPAGSARSTVDRLAAGAPLPMRYIALPRPGVADARNAGVTGSSAPFIAFLDDDQEAPPQWLASLLKTQARFEADVVFGPVRTFLPADARGPRAYLERFFAREGPEESTVLDRYYGCGDSLVRRAALPSQTTPFSPARNRIGGEDDLLFAGMQAAGGRFAWAAEAWVWEHPAVERAQLSYVLRRAFAYGQGPASACAAAGPRRWPMIPVWMAYGAAQAVGFGLAALLQAARPGREAAPMLDRAARGLGKVLWFPPFKIGFYGRTPPPSGPAAACR